MLLTTWLVDQRAFDTEFPVISSSVIEKFRRAEPLSVAERLDRLLKIVANLAPYLGQEVHLLPGAEMAGAARPDQMIPGERGHNQLQIMAWTESETSDEISALVGFASQFLKRNPSPSVSLTFDGHQRLESLQSQRSDLSQAFVAMWFGTEVAAAYEDGIEPAVRHSGYRPMRIDKKEHNNKIDDEVIAEIRRSRFLIADFTCGTVDANGGPVAIPRGGVYYEAGFAQGLGIPVIWMCRVEHINHVHFDTRQFNHITSASPADLREKLRNRIGAVIGDGPLLES